MQVQVFTHQQETLSQLLALFLYATIIHFQILKQDVALKMAQIQRHIAQQRDRYSELNLPVPDDLAVLISNLNDLEGNVTDSLQDQQENLREKRKNWQECKANLKVCVMSTFTLWTHYNILNMDIRLLS